MAKLTLDGVDVMGERLSEEVWLILLQCQIHVNFDVLYNLALKLTCTSGPRSDQEKAKFVKNFFCGTFCGRRSG